MKQKEDEEGCFFPARQRASSEMNDISSCSSTLPLRELIAPIQTSTNRWNCSTQGGYLLWTES